MREYWLLTKIQLSSMYGINRLRHARDDDSRKKGKRAVWAFVAMVFGLGWASTFYSMALSAALRPISQMPALLGLMAMASGALVLLFGVFEAKSMLFRFGDYDTVMSWPVSTVAVVAARVTVMYVYNLIYALLLMLPAGVVYAVAVHPPVWFYAVYLVGMIVTPALPTVAGAILGTLVTVLTVRMKKRGIFASLLQIAAGLGVMAISFSMSSGLQNLEERVASIAGSIGTIWPPAGWLMRAVEGDVAALLLSVVLAALLMLVFTWILSRYFVKLNGRLSAMPHTSTKLGNMRKASGKVRALYRTEWKRYVGSSLYLANTAFGYVMLLALAVVLGIVKLPAVEQIFSDPAYPQMRTALPLVVSLLITMSATTGSAISIEGKRLWIVKSLPVSAREWLTAKLFVSLTLAVPTILLFTVIVGVGMRFAPAEWLYTILTPIGYALLSGVLGLAVNLWLPKFDWTSETEIVKQSASTMICVFGGMLIAGLPLGLMLALDSAWILPAATAAAFLLAGIGFRVLTARGGERLYRL